MDRYDFYGNNGYQRTFNTHGIQVINKPAKMPDAALGIGAAEITASIPLLFSYEPIMKMPDIAPVASVDDTFIKTKGGGLTMDGFSQANYFGEAIGGF